jgi:hypothetical protein
MISKFQLREVLLIGSEMDDEFDLLAVLFIPVHDYEKQLRENKVSYLIM